MAFNLMQQGRFHKNTVDAISRSLADQESRRNMTNENLEAAQDQQKSNTVGSFAGMGLQHDVNRGAFNFSQDAAPVVDAGSTTAEIDAALSANGGTAPIVDAVGSGTAGDVALAKELGMAEQTLAASGEQAITDAATSAVAEQAALETAKTGAADALLTTAGAEVAAPIVVEGVAGTAAAGAEAGALAGPWGMAAGAAIGLLASSLF